ncbi:uncharacterized protein LOC131025924 [Salvia miltiorrhiza]|uniref:uncharacterized protein LOC131025924 n=1 Tax=Salvia miltiorrhiza TaxID=226208 RepID=UPI0025AC6D0E|nr:uncharacterized protein LOC131025924 [Salvia miltiorrhiza]
MVKWHRSNQIIKKLSIDGVISEDQATMAAHVIQFHEDLFSEPISGVVDRSWISGYIPSSVTSPQADLLTALPSADDIRSVVFSMDRNSALGPDDFNGAFFQHSWEVADAILVSNYRPIVLGNFFFKVITKILASRLNAVAAEIVSANQFDFISGRSIQECILLASEGVNCMERSIQRRNMVLKVDIRKAFDTLSWEFVDVVLDSFGFPPLFRQWIRVIFQSAWISVLFNGEQHGFFSCSRGVRHVDPLSSILFSLAEEVLSRLLLDAADRGFIARMRMSRSLLFPSHLLYAVDVLLFCKAERRSCRMIESILHIYAPSLISSVVPPLPGLLAFGITLLPISLDGRACSGYRIVDRIVIPVEVHHSLGQSISDYYFDDSWHLTLGFLQAFLDIAFDIVSIPISGGEDRRAWTHSYFGEVSSSLAMDHVHPSFPNAGEDIDHLFWECATARHVWSFLFTWFRVDGSSIYDIRSLIIWAMNVPASKQVDNLWRVGVMSTVWSLWNLRNRAVFDEALTIQVKAFILEASRFSLGEMANSVEELLILHGLGVPGRPRRPISYLYVFWLPPPHLWRKINIDGSVHGSPHLIHADGIIQDS